MYLKKDVLKAMLLRAPQWNANKLHPKSRIIMNTMTQPLEPLQYKLQEIPENCNQFSILGNTENLPFQIERTHTGNLPIYRKYRHGRMQQRTIVRKISGDVEAFEKELAKVVSNSEIITKVGRVEIKGLHRNTIQLWLQRLGF